jgi:hypothetical protein
MKRNSPGSQAEFGFRIASSDQACFRPRTTAARLVVADIDEAKWNLLRNMERERL